MKFFDEQNINKVIFFSSTTLVLLLSLAFGLLYVTEKQLELKKELSQIEQDFINQQKQLLHTSVNQLIHQIDTSRRLVRSRLKNYLQKKTKEAISISTNLYNSKQLDIASADKGTLIKEALRPICLDDDQEYYFIINTDGTLMLYPPEPTLEGKSFCSIYPERGKELLQKMKETTLERGEGFLQYQWKKPGTDKNKCREKLSYIALFKPLGWLIGSGEFINDRMDVMQQEVIKDLKQSMEPGSPSSYFFIYDLHNENGGADFATMIVNPNRPDLIGQYLSDEFQDDHGKKFRKEFLQGIREQGEAFVSYRYPKTDTNSYQNKLSYFKLYPEWNWVIAKGTYLDELESIIADKKDELHEEVRKKIFHFMLLSLIAVSIAICLAHFSSKGINSIIEKYKKRQEAQQNKLELINRMLHKQATTDGLTSLYNRKYFNDQLAREISRSKRYNIPLSLIMFDIDHFKAINDTFGHIQGDNVLKELSRLIKNKIRKSDILARWGGEEFILLSPETNQESAGIAAEKLCTLVGSHSFSIDKQVTCSFGVTALLPDDQAGDFINRVDNALYKAKAAGRNTYYIL